MLQLEGVELDKTEQCSDWGDAENLSVPPDPEQLRYAANDVRYLISMREKLITKLQREDRWELAQDCFKALPTIVALDLFHSTRIFSPIARFDDIRSDRLLKFTQKSYFATIIGCPISAALDRKSNPF